MNTRVIRIDPLVPDAAALIPAAQALRRGEIVAFPTETVYGLGAVWRDPEAVREIFRVKGRPQDNPLIVHEASIGRMRQYFRSWDSVAECLASSFCPGPFTLIMEHKENIDSPVTAGLATIGVRIPAHPVAQMLIELCGEGLAAPSANLSGRPSPTSGADALEDLDGKVPYIIDAGPCEVGVESTIISWVDGKLELLRPGGISAEEILKVLHSQGLNIPLITEDAGRAADHEPPRAPGMKYRHYAPQARVHILRGETEEAKLEQLSRSAAEGILGSRPAFYLSEAIREKAMWILEGQNVVAFELITFTTEQAHKAAAQGLFAAFRAFDRSGCSDIWAEEQSLQQLGAAYMNRLRKASAQQHESLRNDY